MLTVILYEDVPDGGALRRAHFDDHIAFMDRHRDRIALGRNLRETPQAEPLGGIWAVEAEPAEAERLFRADPYFRAGLRRFMRVMG